MGDMADYYEAQDDMRRDEGTDLDALDSDTSRGVANPPQSLLTHTNRKELLTLLYHHLPTATEIAESPKPVLQDWLRKFNTFVETELKKYE